MEKNTEGEGEFEGCDFEKKRMLRNGWTLTCNTVND